MPCESAASASMPVSGRFGMKAAARSPARRPSARKACSARDTSLVRSEKLRRRLKPVSSQSTNASPRSPRRIRFSAKLSRASGNQRAPGILSPSTSTVLPRLRDAITPQKSHTSVQNSSGLSTVQW